MTFFPPHNTPEIKRYWSCALAALFALSSVCHADEQQSIQDLKSRIEAVEQQNRQLTQELEQQRILIKSQTGSQAATDRSRIEAEVDAVFSESGDDNHIRSVIRDYLAEQEAQKTVDGGHSVGSNLSMHASWHNGLEVATQNKDFRVHVGGRTQFDSSWFHADSDVQSDPTLVNPIRDGVDFRRARIRIDGVMYDRIEWIVEYDFVNSVLALPSAAGSPAATGVPAPTDLFWTFTHLPCVGNFRIGNQKEPIGFEHLVSSRFLPFMERSFNQDAFYGAFNNGFTPGISLFNSACDDHVTWAIGGFKPTTNIFAFNTGGGEYAVTGRLTVLPWYVEEGRGLLHLGVSARQAGMDNGLARFRTRGPERAGIGSVWPLYADSGQINGNGQQMINFEAVTNLGSLTIQAEYLLNYVQSAFRTGGPEVGTVFYHGGYVEALYFLTGEHRAYNRRTAHFDRVVPVENAFQMSRGSCDIFGCGAWQVGARYNYLDLNDQGINGGRLNDVTFGLNWFLNPNMKLQWNYSLTERDSSVPQHDGLIQGFGMRLAHDF